MKSFLYRSVWLPAIITAVLLLIALSLLVSMSWRSLQRLQPMHEHLELVNEVQATGLHLQQVLVESIRDGTPITAGQIQELRHEVARIAALDGHMTTANITRLHRLQYLLAGLDSNDRVALIAALGLMRTIISTETAAHDQLVTRVKRDTSIEFEVAAGTMLVVPLLALITLFLLRHRILTPLNNLRALMSMLAQQDYSSAPTDNVAPMLLPLFNNYNHLVGRLAELEQTHQARQQTLENEVRNATQALLQQQRSLANAERLAAVGEVAAGLAHELRNPLAGIQMALGNLRSEMGDTEHGERLDMVIDELRRITRLLNDLLHQARQEPERPKQLHLHRVVEQLLSLARYQLPSSIALRSDIPGELYCRLPEGAVRQALLNLILNSADALGQGPGTIAIEGRSEEPGVRLSVCDDGPGFPAPLLDTGVRPFSTGRDQGTGLGLAMVRRFASDLGGELRLANRKPKGACATLLLPCKEARDA
ncbi:MAG: ATP-binding protein [Gammaproteobacteria bacterium]